MYLKISAEKKVKKGEHAAEHRVLATVQYYTTKLLVPLVNVVTMDHCFNLECRHCFSASHHLQLVDESAKSVRLVPRVYARPARNSLIVGVAYLSGVFAKLFQ